MGLLLTIGDRNPRSVFGAPRVRLPDAPADGSDTDYTNQRNVRGIDWAHLVQQVQLDGLFTIDHHVDVPLTQQHLDVLREKVAAYRHLYGTACDITTHNGRLNWLLFWTEWALTHCKHPVFCGR